MAVASRSGLRTIGQSSFAAGAYPQREEIPANGAEDIVNGFIDEDGAIVRRGGSTYKGTLAGSSSQPMRTIWDGYLAAGPRTLASRKEGAAERWYTLDADDTTWIDLGLFGGPNRGRPIGTNGMLAFGYAPALFGVTLWLWAGARGGKPQALNQTVTVTKNSKNVTGTNFTTNAEPGTVLTRVVGNDHRVAVVESVQSATQITLTKAWQGPTETTSAMHFAPTWGLSLEAVDQSTTMFPAGSTKAFVASMFDRVIAARGNRLGFTAAGDPLVFGAITDYHELPAGARVIGLEPLRDELLVFTTQGVFVLDDLAFDLTDAEGNPQQRLERSNPELILWDNRGITGWEGDVIAPCTDDIYLIDSAASTRPIAGGMRTLYRAYVKAGYQTGLAVTYRNHYLLPILNGDTWTDTLVCNLQTGAWTRWNGHGGSVGAFARRVGDDIRQPKLLAVANANDYRVLDNSGTFEPSASGKQDANATSHQLEVTTRTYSVGDLAVRQWRRLRARYELDDAASDNPTLTLEAATDRLESPFSDVSGTAEAGELRYTWSFSKRAQAIRFRIKSQAPSSLMRLRQLELFFRPTGRQ